MYEGRFVGLVPGAEAEIGRIGLLMTGGGDAMMPTASRRRAARMTIRLEPRLRRRAGCRRR